MNDRIPGPTAAEIETLYRIMDWLDQRFTGRFDGCLPRDYCAMDLETSGFSYEDYICGFGHCDVVDAAAETYETRILNWADPTLSNQVNLHTLDNRLHKCANQMGDNFHGITLEKMRTEGIHPEEVLNWMLTKCETCIGAGTLVVGHSFVLFDATRLSKTFDTWFDVQLEWPEDSILDTSAIEKALRLLITPRYDETLAAFFKRVLRTPAPTVKHGLSNYCVFRYNLDKKYGLDMRNAHRDPGFDAMLCHLLVEEYRQLAGC